MPKSVCFRASGNDSLMATKALSRAVGRDLFLMDGALHHPAGYPLSFSGSERLPVSAGSCDFVQQSLFGRCAIRPGIAREVGNVSLSAAGGEVRGEFGHVRDRLLGFSG
ncbi:hypothetical protein L284_09185 [Novosphingobium lindaniclasticum LE124]|uniref:Uncharacterized protein n=1 Tax=Novosphingobium lindaniclasticum LE124 TaxID=1096930 RepID=T0HUB6_9SPHN|nr:hypothetical protein L284_09185 [Novosphingobium lindaniclasticum LE124]